MSGDSSQIHICLRQTVDWSYEAAFLTQLDPGFAPKVHIWNRTFSLPYHAFRLELRQLAQANIEAVAGAVRSPWDEVPEGGLVVPVDDDDWFSPQLVKIIQTAVTPDMVGLHWRQSALKVPINTGHRLRLLQRRLIPSMSPRWLCATNSYLIRNGQVDPSCFISHVAASRWFPQQSPDRIRLLPKRLNLHHRSQASITSLNFGKPSISARQLRRRERSYSRLCRRSQALPEELGWAIPSQQRMDALMDRLWGRER